jgi:hypothetical protein
MYAGEREPTPGTGHYNSGYNVHTNPRYVNQRRRYIDNGPVQNYQPAAFGGDLREYAEYVHMQPESQMRNREQIQFSQSQGQNRAVQFIRRPQGVYYPRREEIMQEGGLQEIYNNQTGREYEYSQQEDFANRMQHDWVQQVCTEGRGTIRNSLKKPLRNEQNTEGVEKQEKSKREEELKAQVKEMLLKAKYEDRIEIEKEEKKLQETKKKQQLEWKTEEREKEDKKKIEKLEDQLKHQKSYIAEMEKRNECLVKNKKCNKNS